MNCSISYLFRFLAPLVGLILWLAGLPGPCCLGQNIDAGLRPNIVVIMGDDWSWPHASALKDKVVKTPNFDRIAAEGVLFENAFVSAPSCTPSRFAIVSGQYHWRLGAGDSLGGSLKADVPVYPDLLSASGYQTGFARKGCGPSKHEFRGSDPLGKPFKNFDEFMGQRDKSKPFCFWYGAGEPHRPYDWQASKTSDMSLDKMKVPTCLPDNETVRTDIGDYYLRVQKLDRFAGEIVKRLESEKQLENTIVIMTSDNGMPFPRCKATLYDLGTRVPLAIRWGKSIKAGRTIKDFVSLTDLAPTILEATGIAIPKTITGGSLMAQLKSESSGWVDEKRDTVLIGRERHVLDQPARAIRTKKFLYVRNFSPASWLNGTEDGKRTLPQPHYDFSKNGWPTKPPAFSYAVDPSPTKQWMLEHSKESGVAKLNALAFKPKPDEELYELSSDPGQLKNLAKSPKFRAERDRLSKLLTAKLTESGDPRFKLSQHASFKVQGWKVHLNHELWQEKPKVTKKMLGLLADQLERAESVVPKKALGQIRQIPIWINPTYQGVQPKAEYHPGVAWLKDNARNPAMAKSIEVTNVDIFDFEDKRMPFFMLHELSHAYHDQVLGFRNPKIREAFEAARDSGRYDSVKRYTGKKTVNEKAYAVANEKEYFAESTEAYFGKNDYFPRNRKQLKKHDPAIHDLIEELWGVAK